MATRPLLPVLRVRTGARLGLGRGCVAVALVSVALVSGWRGTLAVPILRCGRTVLTGRPSLREVVLRGPLAVIRCLGRRPLMLLRRSLRVGRALAG